MAEVTWCGGKGRRAGRYELSIDIIQCFCLALIHVGCYASVIYIPMKWCSKLQW
jgi:hypothetical protein